MIDPSHDEKQRRLATCALGASAPHASAVSTVLSPANEVRELFKGLHQVLACAHPLMFSLPDEDYPFFGGTCFTVQYRGRLFVLTARHCLNNVQVRSTRIECGGPENYHFPLKRWTYFEQPGLSDSDLGDIAVFEVDMERMTESEIAGAPRLKLADTFVYTTEPPMRCDLILEGYPYGPSEFSLELHVTLRPGCKLLAVYEGATERAGISTLSIKRAGDLRDMNGMSGSPVVAFRWLLDGTVKYRLAGMLIQGSIMTGRGYFIQSGVLLQALRRCVESSIAAPEG